MGKNLYILGKNSLYIWKGFFIYMGKILYLKTIIYKDIVITCEKLEKAKINK